MRRLARPVLVTLVTVMAVSLLSTTAFARYRATLGPAKCCKSHCKKQQPSETEAKRCCSQHLSVLPQGTSKDASADAALSPALAAVAPFVALPAGVAAAPTQTEDRAPPGRSLVALHTSLSR
jgi:hypothetical protein